MHCVSKIVDVTYNYTNVINKLGQSERTSLCLNVTPRNLHILLNECQFVFLHSGIFFLFYMQKQCATQDRFPRSVLPTCLTQQVWCSLTIQVNFESIL